MTMLRRATMSAVIASATCIGCGGGGNGAAALDSEAAKAADPARNGPVPVQIPLAPSAGGGDVASDLKAIADAALADASRRTGRPSAELVVARAESVVWGDGSLGCPQPGMAYTMALVPGYRVRIRTGALLLDYHASGRGQLLLCPAELAVDPTPLQPS